MLKQRVITGVIAVAVLLIVVFGLPQQATIAVLALLILAGAWEWSGFLKVSSLPARVGYVALVALAIVGISVYAQERPLPVVRAAGMLAIAVWLLAALVIVRFPLRFPKPVVALTGLLVLVTTFVSLAWLYLGPDGPRRLMLLLLLVWSADIGAYFAGKRFGSTKLAPRVSPGKTWEGVIGGLVLVACVSMVGAAALDLPVTLLLPLALAVAAISIVGDLTVSMFKRNADLKDSGSLFPGHGGVLDRIDSICAAAPLFVLVLARMAGG